jgi:hypothetical protein
MSFDLELGIWKFEFGTLERHTFSKKYCTLILYCGLCCTACNHIIDEITLFCKKLSLMGVLYVDENIIS